ncbi:MAG TPA: DUF190 domain-containing protein [Acidobacteriaceae bacterium]|jgi:hypothetical protein|nr:DUF190 domain-containing protein [Acidobacteriaceae bacterium]
MREEFPARMLRIHFGENDQWQGRPLPEAMIALCREMNIAEALVFRGIEGYGRNSRIRRASHWMFSSDAPLMLCVVDSEEQIGKLIPHLKEMVQDGLIALSRVEAIRTSR